MTDFEREDMELSEVMGGRFTDMTKCEKSGEKTARKPVDPKESNPGKNKPKEEKSVNAQWEPVKPEPNFMDKLKATAKEVGIYGVLSMILFWWQQTGKLEETTAWYSLLVCVGMVFFSIGKNCRGGVK